MHHVAQLEDGRVGEKVVDVQSFFPPGNEARGVQRLQVLGDVRLPEAGLLDDLGDRLFAAAQAQQNFQACRLGQRLESLGDEADHLCRQLRPSHERVSGGDV